MAENKERKGVLPQIIVAVVVALLVGGSAPWWWHEIFPDKPANPPQTNPPGHPNPPPDNPPPPNGGPIRVQFAANPYSIPPGGQTEIRVLAFTEQNTPVSNANVRIESGGGWFSASGTTTEIGQTDQAGAFRTLWRAPSPAARGYGISATVTKDRFIDGKGELMIAIQ